MSVIEVVLFGVLVLVTGRAQAMVYCDPEFCNRVDCRPITSCPEGERLLRGGSVCGCCNTCVTLLGWGERCRDPPMPGPNLVTKVCDDDFFCHEQHDVCVRKTCRMLTQELQERIDAADGMLVGYTRPNCNPDGSFAPVQCRGAMCYCVSGSGEPLKKYSLPYQFHRADSEGVTCQCALDEHSARQGQTQSQREFMCRSNGNYYGA